MMTGIGFVIIAITINIRYANGVEGIFIKVKDLLIVVFILISFVLIAKAIKLGQK
ncbi:hypothetical protein QFZ28_005931 [Neobacillus niacini]|nr:hypothetical protein [Neobacillus niacini]